MLRTEIDDDAFDAVLFSLDTVVADLGYADIRPLPGAMAWIEQLRHRGKRIGAFAPSERAGAALEIAGVAELFDKIARAVLARGAAPGRSAHRGRRSAGNAARDHVTRPVVLEPAALRAAGSHGVDVDPKCSTVD